MRRVGLIPKEEAVVPVKVVPAKPAAIKAAKPVEIDGKEVANV